MSDPLTTTIQNRLLAHLPAGRPGPRPDAAKHAALYRALYRYSRPGEIAVASQRRLGAEIGVSHVRVGRMLATQIEKGLIALDSRGEWHGQREDAKGKKHPHPENLCASYRLLLTLQGEPVTTAVSVTKEQFLYSFSKEKEHKNSEARRPCIFPSRNSKTIWKRENESQLLTAKQFIAFTRKQKRDFVRALKRSRCPRPLRSPADFRPYGAPKVRKPSKTDCLRFWERQDIVRLVDSANESWWQCWEEGGKDRYEYRFQLQFEPSLTFEEHMQNRYGHRPSGVRADAKRLAPTRVFAPPPPPAPQRKEIEMTNADELQRKLSAAEKRAAEAEALAQSLRKELELKSAASEITDLFAGFAARHREPEETLAEQMAAAKRRDRQREAALELELMRAKTEAA